MLAAAAAAMVALTLTGCDKVSEDTKRKGNEAMCAGQESSIASLKAGGAGARAVGSLVRDVSDDGTEINKIAAKVASNHGDDQARQRLATMLKKRCE